MDKVRIDIKNVRCQAGGQPSICKGLGSIPALEGKEKYVYIHTHICNYINY